jgi:hypothetical protein
MAICYHGDYDQVAVTNGVGHIVWSDDRRITEFGPNPDIYYDGLIVEPSRGILVTDETIATCSGSVASFILIDHDLEGAGSQPIVITSSNGDLETLVLVEDPENLGRFTGTISTAGVPVVTENGVLNLVDSAVVVATYNDADDGTGPAATSVEFVSDCLAPAVEDVTLGTLSGTSLALTVETSEPATVAVEFGTSCAALTETVSAGDDLATIHAVTLADLTPGTTYFFAVVATDAVGNVARDDNGGACYSFTTFNQLFFTDFEAGLGGFVIDNDFGLGGGLWHLSTACSAAEPGHSLPTTLYYGQDATCNYETGIPNEGVATSPSILVPDADTTVLDFQYFLNSEAFDRVSVEVSVAGGPFVVVASTFGEGEPLSTFSGVWQKLVIDISSLLPSSGSASIQVRFHFDTVDAIGNIFQGFHVDDVGVFADTSDGGDTTPPTFTFVPADITTTTCGSPALGTATATDPSGVTVTNDAPAAFVPGETLVTWTATDGAGNFATATQLVTLLLTNNSACCPAGTNIILGTSGDNTLNGTSGSDCMLGDLGQDTLNGQGGNDYLSGGDGDDILNGGDGDDRAFGGLGQNQIHGDSGVDVLFGGINNDVITGGPGDDVLRGEAGQDSLQGQDGNDTLFGDGGDDTLSGGNQNDDLVGGSGNDNCNGGAGTNTTAACEFGAPNSCADGAQNGTETALDCGGGCADCPAGRACVSGGDCQASLFCVLAACTAS